MRLSRKEKIEEKKSKELDGGWSVCQLGNDEGQRKEGAGA